MTNTLKENKEKLQKIIARLEAVKPVKQVNFKRMPDGIIEIEDYEKLSRYESEREGQEIDRFGE
tara:strand:+ start:2448 stop:2639 length:192 start_codon:yes stop_codon:yes gene_type:complete